MCLSAKAIGKDQKIGDPNCAIAIQIEPRVKSRVALTRSELRCEQQKVGEIDPAIAIEIRRQCRGL